MNQLSSHRLQGILVWRLSANTQAVRGVKTLDFAGTKEQVYERADWPLDKLQE